MTDGITFVWLVIFVLYFLPWFIALKRSHKNTTLIFFLNLCFGWSGVGWFACLIWASVSSAKDPAEPVVVIQQTSRPRTSRTSEMKACPFCGEEILAVAKKCKHCQSDLATKNGSEPANEVLAEATQPASRKTIELPSYQCPNCDGPLNGGEQECPHCKADFAAPGSWKPKRVTGEEDDLQQPAVLTDTSVVAKPSKSSMKNYWVAIFITCMVGAFLWPKGWDFHYAFYAMIIIGGIMGVLQLVANRDRNAKTSTVVGEAVGTSAIFIGIVATGYFYLYPEHLSSIKFWNAKPNTQAELIHPADGIKLETSKIDTPPSPPQSEAAKIDTPGSPPIAEAPKEDTPRTDTPPPPSKAVPITAKADVNDIAAVPFLTPEGKEKYREFLNSGTNRVFVINSRTGYASWGRHTNPLWLMNAELESCRQWTEKTSSAENSKYCFVYAVNSDVVAKGQP